jgi:hypothetical protein
MHGEMASQKLEAVQEGSQSLKQYKMASQSLKQYKILGIHVQDLMYCSS